MTLKEELSARQEALESRLAWNLREMASRIVLLDAALFSLFLLDRRFVAGVPIGSMLAVALVGIGLLRQPKYRASNLQLLPIAFVGLFAYLVVVSMLSGVDWQDRMLKLVALALLMWVLILGQIDVPSAIVGLMVGALVNVPAHYAGLASSTEFLTGYWGEKNVAGMWYAVVMILGLWWIRSLGWQTLWLSLAGVLVFLTGSRTAMSALAVAVLWIAFRNKLGVLFRVGLAGGLIWALMYAEEHFARVGVFADRDGTDWLRDQIDRAVALKMQMTPFQGFGLGEAYVYIGDKRWLFHNSFDALRAEGGWPLFVVWMVLIVVVAGSFLRPGAVSYSQRVTEGALIALMVCAWKLGEAFFTSIGFLAIAFAIHARYAVRIEPEPRPETSGMGIHDQN